MGGGMVYSREGEWVEGWCIVGRESGWRDGV